MNKLITLNFIGDFEAGFWVLIREEGKELAGERCGWESNKSLPSDYEDWRTNYLKCLEQSRGFEGGGIINEIEETIKDCKTSYERLVTHFNAWLLSEGGKSCRKFVRERLQPLKGTSGEARVVIQTEKTLLKKMPWHFWERDLFGNICLGRAAIAIGPPKFKAPEKLQAPSKNAPVRILAVLGSNDNNIKTEKDCQVLEALSASEEEKKTVKWMTALKNGFLSILKQLHKFFSRIIFHIEQNKAKNEEVLKTSVVRTILEFLRDFISKIIEHKTNSPNKIDVKCESQPNLADLSRYIKAQEGWGIICYSGHSRSDQNGNLAWLNINNQEQISIEELKAHFKTAIGQNLQLVVFNSCDGLGLAKQLADLYLPQSIVMLEEIPDKVAYVFFKHFFTAFIEEKRSLYPAMRKARYELKQFEERYPGVTSLPVITQNASVDQLSLDSFFLEKPEPIHKDVLKVVDKRIPVRLKKSMSFLSQRHFWKRALQVSGIIVALVISYVGIDAIVPSGKKVILEIENSTRDEYVLTGVYSDEPYLIEHLKFFPSKPIRQAQFKYDDYAKSVDLTQSQGIVVPDYTISRELLEKEFGEKFNFWFLDDERFTFYFQSQDVVDFKCELLTVDNQMIPCEIKETGYLSILRGIPWYYKASLWSFIWWLFIDILFFRRKRDAQYV